MLYCNILILIIRLKEAVIKFKIYNIFSLNCSSVFVSGNVRWVGCELYICARSFSFCFLLGTSPKPEVTDRPFRSSRQEFDYLRTLWRPEGSIPRVFRFIFSKFFFIPEVRKTSVCSWYRYETGIRWSTMCRPIIGVGRDSARRSDSSRAERRTIGESAQPGGTLRSRETHETRRSRTQYLSKRGSGTSRGARAWL